MAMDNFLEEVATKRNRGAETVMYVLANIMMVVFGLWAFLMLQGIMMLINAGEGAGPIIYYVVMTLLTGGIAVLLFLRRDRIRTEYEYTFTNGQMDFAQVFNNKKRKNLGTMNLKKRGSPGPGQFRFLQPLYQYEGHQARQLVCQPRRAAVLLLFLQGFGQAHYHHRGQR